jgi:hypothetical protein
VVLNNIFIGLYMRKFAELYVCAKLFEIAVACLFKMVRLVMEEKGKKISGQHTFSRISLRFEPGPLTAAFSSSRG